jgi:ArsR family transcriptional regulator
MPISPHAESRQQPSGRSRREDGTVEDDPLICCGPGCTEMIDEAAARSLAQSFAALADPTRLRLLSCVASAAPEEVCACDLLEPSGRSQPTVSHHMKVLVDAGLVERDKRGLWVWYRVVPDALETLRATLQ